MQANVLLAETTRESLLVVNLVTGEQLECPMLSTASGNFSVDTDLPDKGMYMWDRDPITTDDDYGEYGIVIQVVNGPDATELTGRVRLSQSTYNGLGYDGYRHQFTPGKFALATDGDAIRIIAARIDKRWYPVFDSDYAVDGPAEASSE